MTPSPELSEPELAKALIACLDLTNLNDDCTENDVAAICDRAVTPYGKVSAICIWPRFVAFARTRLSPGIRIATVVNFPQGTDNPDKTWKETIAAIVDGADEIDMVIDYRRLPQELGFVTRQVRRVKDAARTVTLKAILETGMLAGPAVVEQACAEALAGGADFLKTSTGKTRVSATPEAAAILLSAITDKGGVTGFKPSGGIKSFEDALAYRQLAEDHCGAGWATPARFRIGASSVLTDLIAVAGGAPRALAKSGY